MAGGISVSVRLSPAWRDVRGRFARPPVAGSVANGFQALGQGAVRSLAQATPVITGLMRGSWRASYAPSSMQVRITNLAVYAWYVVYGTRRQRANAQLQQVITQELPRQLQVTADEIGRQILVGLKGG